MRILLLKKKWMTLCLSLLAAGAIFCAAWYPSAVSTAAAKRQLPIYCVETNGEKRCAISFDAAWGADNTQKILDVLEKYDAPATFFVVGNDLACTVTGCIGVIVVWRKFNDHCCRCS